LTRVDKRLQKLVQQGRRGKIGTEKREYEKKLDRRLLTIKWNEKGPKMPTSSTRGLAVWETRSGTIEQDEVERNPMENGEKKSNDSFLKGSNGTRQVMA